MVDQLANIGGDGGPQEAQAVTLFKSKQAGGVEVDFGALSFASQANAALVAAAAYDARLYGTAEAQVTGLSGGDTIALTRSLDGTNYAAVSWIDQTFATGSTISGNGIYSFPGGGYLKWTQTGSASTPAVTVRAAS